MACEQSKRIEEDLCDTKKQVAELQSIVRELMKQNNSARPKAATEIRMEMEAKETRERVAPKFKPDDKVKFKVCCPLPVTMRGVIHSDKPSCGLWGVKSAGYIFSAREDQIAHDESVALDRNGTELHVGDVVKGIFSDREVRIKALLPNGDFVSEDVNRASKYYTLWERAAK